jgi:P pilus assembly chaperone PapD
VAALSLKSLACLLLLPAALSAGPAQAEASLFIYPTLVMFSGNQRSAEVTIANRGDETGTFEIGWTDMSMTEKGSLIGHDQPTEWSMQPFVRYSPRRATLAPSESQVIKIALRPNESAVEREYYSHMRVVTINSGAPEADAPEGQATPQAPSVAIKARTAIAIPVIWRNSRSEPALAFESVTLDYETNAIAVAVRRDGLLSVRGFLHVLDLDSEGELVPLAESVPLIMYPSIERRVVSVPLPEGLSFADLPPGALICFSPDEALTDASAVLASSPIIPAQ